MARVSRPTLERFWMRHSLGHKRSLSCSVRMTWPVYALSCAAAVFLPIRYATAQTRIVFVSAFEPTPHKTEARTLPAEAGRKLPKNRTLFTIQLSPEEY
jgi:hypothetical protein